MIDLHKGDCLEIMKNLPPVDMILADPPYGTTACKWDSIIPLDDMWQRVKYLLKSNGVAAMTASQPFTSALVMSNPDMFRHEWIWLKNRGSNFANTVREPMKEHEVVLIFSKGKWTYNRQMQPRTGGGVNMGGAIQKGKGGDTNNYGDFDGKDITLSELRVPSSWQKFNTACGKEKVKHPTQKPVALMEYLIKTYTNEGDTVLDFCMGSGTTGVACKNLNRDFIGIEQDDEYFEIAEDRILNKAASVMKSNNEE